jgi:hypothetical protein
MEIITNYITNSMYEVGYIVLRKSKHRVIASSAIYMIMMRYKDDKKIDVHST